MSRNLALLALICLIGVPVARAQEFSPLGSFENVRESSGEEPHCYGWSLELWRHRGQILGLLDEHAGLCGDPPCQTVTDVSYDAKSGRLTFAAFGMPFVGTLRKNELVGTLGTERVRLKRSKMWPMDAASDKSIAAWCQFWRGIRRCTGVSELCRVLDVALQADRPAQPLQLRLELQCRDAGRLLAAIHNEGAADTAVIFGSVLNGAKYIVGDLRVMVRRDGEPDHFRMFRPRHYPALIGGRLDDWIVPLPAGASYGLPLAVKDFEGWRTMTSFPASTIRLRLAVRAPSLGNRSFRVWTDNDALVSNEVHIPDDCR